MKRPAGPAPTIPISIFIQGRHKKTHHDSALPTSYPSSKPSLTNSHFTIIIASGIETTLKLSQKHILYLITLGKVFKEGPRNFKVVSTLPGICECFILRFFLWYRVGIMNTRLVICCFMCAVDAFQNLWIYEHVPLWRPCRRCWWWVREKLHIQCGSRLID